MSKKRRRSANSFAVLAALALAGAGLGVAQVQTRVPPVFTHTSAVVFRFQDEPGS